jgi:pilus assembly protein Flp/PilA
MSKTLKSFISDESGATAIEYGLMCLIIGIGFISSIQSLPGALNDFFDDAAAGLGSAS